MYCVFVFYISGCFWWELNLQLFKEYLYCKGESPVYKLAILVLSWSLKLPVKARMQLTLTHHREDALGILYLGFPTGCFLSVLTCWRTLSTSSFGSDIIMDITWVLTIQLTYWTFTWLSSDLTSGPSTAPVQWQMKKWRALLDKDSSWGRIQNSHTLNMIPLVPKIVWNAKSSPKTYQNQYSKQYSKHDPNLYQSSNGILDGCRTNKVKI